MPKPVLAALEHVFDPSVGAVKVIEHSRYARVHLGVTATTRPNHILLAIGGDEFVSNPELLLHEYFHVIHQWGSGRLTRRGYLVEWARRGYWNNRFEVEARDFSSAAAEHYRGYIRGEG